MESHVNEYSEVKEALLLEVKRSEPMKDSGSLRRRRRRDPHSGTSGSEFTATTGISEEILGLKAKKKPSNRRHDSESDVERQLLEAMMEIVGLKAKKKTSNRRHESKSDLKRQLLEARMEILGLKMGSCYKEIIPAASRDQLPIAIDGEADLIGQEMAKDDEIDLVLQEIQMLENAPDGPLLAMANNQEGWRLKDVLTWVFPITSFTLELPSAVFDQLSSKDHSHYAHIVMLISFIALVACIAELIYKGKKERVTWQPRDRVPWFHCRQTGKPFCSLWEIIGFACAFLQCVVTAINYSFISRHLDGPIKTSALPILFAFGLLCSKYFEKPGRNRGGRPNGGSEADLVQVLVEP